MSPERWSRIEELFDAAFHLEPDARGPYLDAECRDDPGLRRELEAMLCADAAEPVAIRDAIAAAAEIAREQTGDESLVIGRRFGPYRVTGLLGHGGMGSVYQAVRDDQVYTGDVAIKILRNEFLDGPAARERFRQERQILATLTHPHIARLLDGGENPAPYLVLEKIAGVPVTEYCERLPVEARLRLFLKVCDAVQYAHTHLVVHRDLKPANILVTAEGEPKLLDFGIAKLLPDEGATENDGGLTQTGMRLLTPEYASPEQFRGEPITTASDVYSLGAILYEVLAGVPPHRLDKMSAGQMERAVTVHEPERPSAASQTPNGRLAGDLDNIVMLALSKEPGRRYRSVEALGDDVRRHLDGRPVLARPATARYRVTKFLRRHAWETAAVCLITASLVIGLASALYQARLAQRRFADVRQLANRFLFEFDDSIRDVPGTTKSRELVVRTAQEYLGRLAREAGDDPDFLGELAAAYTKVGEVQGSPTVPSLGRTSDALASYAQARQLWERVLAARPRDSKALRALAQVRLATGDLLRVAGRIEESGKMYADGATAALEAAKAAPGDPELIYLAAGAWMRKGDYQSGVSDYAAARDSFLRTLELYRRAAELRPQDRYRYAVAITLARLGLTASAMERIDEARSYHEQSLALRQEILGRNPKVAAYRRGYAAELPLVGAIFSSSQSLNLNNPATAEGYFRRAVQMQRSLADADPNDRTSRMDLLIVNMRLCETIALTRPTAALPFCTDAIAAGDVLTEATSRADANQYTALAELGQATALLALHRGPAARASAESALRRMQASGTLFIGKRYNRMRAYTAIGDSYVGQGDMARARGAFLAAKGQPLEKANEAPELVQVRQMAWIDERLARLPGEDRCAHLREAGEQWAEWRRRGGGAVKMESAEGCGVKE